MAIADQKQSIFFDEWMVSKSSKSIPISTTCNVSCIFCSNNQNPFEVHKNIFRPIDDFEKNLNLLDAGTKLINLSQSLPGRISEGEAAIHPNFFEILDLIKKKFGQKCEIEFSTNGAVLDEEFISRLAKYMPVCVRTLSLNTADPEHWQTIHKRGKKQAEIAISAAHLLQKYKVPFWGSVVCMPKITGWEDIDETLGLFFKTGTVGALLWYFGYTKSASQEILNLAYPLDELYEFASRMRKKHRQSIIVTPDPLEYTDLAGNLFGIIRDTMFYKAHHVLWLSSKYCWEQLAKKISDYRNHVWNNHYVVSTPNITYGGNIGVSGLLTVDDYINAASQFIKMHPEVDLVLVPAVSFDTHGKDLLFKHHSEIEKACKRRVGVV